MDIYLALIIGHIAGTILGVGGATLIEVILNRSLADDQMSPDERSIMKSLFTTVRVGLVLAILTGFGFLLLYKFTGQTFRLYNPVLWAKLVIIMIIAVNTLLLQAHRISLYWGSAFSFISWWSAALLGVFLTNSVRYSFLEIMLVYVAAVLVGAVVLDWVRKWIKVQRTQETL